MSIGTVLSWMFCGLIVGTFARFLVPGRQSMGILMTALLGIGGALLGGFIYSFLDGRPDAPFALTTDRWAGWIVAILGAMLLLWISPYALRRRWSK